MSWIIGIGSVMFVVAVAAYIFALGKGLVFSNAHDMASDDVDRPTAVPIPSTSLLAASIQGPTDVGINPFACQLVAESLLKHPKPEEIEFFLPIDRSDCADWVGVRFILEPIKTAKEA